MLGSPPPRTPQGARSGSEQEVNLPGLEWLRSGSCLLLWVTWPVLTDRQGVRGCLRIQELSLQRPAHAHTRQMIHGVRRPSSPNVRA